MSEMKVYPIGRIEQENGEMKIVLAPEYAKGLKGLRGFSHVQVLWWMAGCDNARDRSVLTEKKPYTKGPEEMGVFAMRSRERPNRIAVSSVEIAYVNEAAGTVGLYYIDAFPNTPALDLKPYTPGFDRIEHPSVPAWCAHWPGSYEESGCFDREAEFNF